MELWASRIIGKKCQGGDMGEGMRVRGRGHAQWKLIIPEHFNSCVVYSCEGHVTQEA